MDVMPPCQARQGTAESELQGTGLLNIAGEKIGCSGILGHSTVYKKRTAGLFFFFAENLRKISVNLQNFACILLLNVISYSGTWGISTVGSALHSHCRGHRFESGMLHHKSCISMQDFLFYTPVSAGLLRENCRFVNDVNVLTTILTTIQRKTSIFSMTSRFVSIVE